jgi:predicted dehydrogenase
MPDLRITDGVKVSAVSSNWLEKAEAFAREWDIPAACATLDELAARDDVDLVYVLTPPGSHFDCVKRALLAGKHVLCEKPLALTKTEAATLAHLARSRGLFLMEAMWMKFNPAIRAAAELANSGALGNVAAVSAGFGLSLSRHANPRFWSPKLGGGALLDLGIYPVALAHMFLGAPTAVRAVGDIRADGLDFSESVTLVHPAGRVSQLSASISHVVPPRAWISGTDGYISLDAPFWAVTAFDHFQGLGTEGTPTTVRYPREGAGYVPMFRAVAAAIRQGEIEHPWHPLAASIAVMSTLDKIRATLLNGKRGWGGSSSVI